jgi:hypothetical protein
MFGIDDILAIGLKLLDKAIPDPQARQMAQLELLKAQQAGQLAEMADALERSRLQADVNKVEAASPDRFVAGWRPFIGWVCGSALAWHYIGRPLADWLIAINGAVYTVPAVDLGDLIVILLGMLGLGAQRSFDKLKGTSK